MLWIKALHVTFMVAWFAGLFYLPRLFVYHALCDDEAGRARFKVMERKLYLGIMAPAALLTILSGAWLLIDYAWGAYQDTIWLPLKLACVLILIGYHLWCGRLLRAFREDCNRRSHVFFRWFNELPVLLLLAIVVLVIVKPF